MKVLNKNCMTILWIINNLCKGFYINNENFVPHEIQHAECTVTAGEVKASAEAKTTKTLKGVCGSEEMRKAFEELELKIEHKFEELKNIIQNHSKGITTINSISTTQFNNNNTITSNAKNHSRTPLSNQQVGPSINRYAEIERLNKTIISGEDLKFFSYYWKIENFTRKLENIVYTTESSPLFSIFGKTFNILASFRYLGRDFLHLRLQILSSEQQLSKNKFISLNTETTGNNMFKDINNLIFKHKIAILNQVDTYNNFNF